MIIPKIDKIYFKLTKLRIYFLFKKNEETNIPIIKIITVSIILIDKVTSEKRYDTILLRIFLSIGCITYIHNVDAAKDLTTGIIFFVMFIFNASINIVILPIVQPGNS